MIAAENRKTGRWADRAAVGVLIAVAVVAVLTFRDYGLGWDDYTHSQYADLLLAFYRSGLRDRRAFDFVNLYYYGGGFDMAAALAAKISPFTLFETRRLAGAIVGILGMIATWRLGRRIGGPWAGVAALALIATCPLYVGHMFMNPKDAPFAAAMALFLLALTRAFAEYPRPRAGTIALFGTGLGLAIGSRILGFFAGLYALPAFLLIAIVEARRDGARAAAGRMVRFALWLLPALVLGYAIMALIWPWAALSPLNPLVAVEYFSKFFEKPWQELFGGALIAAPDMPRSYVPTLMALKLPVLLLLLGFGGALGAFVACARRALDVRERASLLALALAGTLPIAVTVIERPAMYNGIRHFVFLLPPLAALGGLAAVWLFEHALRRRHFALGAATALFLAGLASPVFDMVRLHPYEYTHFNHLAGGVRGAAKNYMLDYWGLSLKQASDALRAWLASHGEQPKNKTWMVAVCGPHPPAEVALGNQFETTWNPKGADFAMMLGTFYCARFDAPVITTIERDGVVYARVYDIRGRNFDSVLTQPPP